MTELSLALLGPPVVKRDGEPVTFDTRKAIALLALLAVTGREHSREQLADLLWPDADSAKGRASLRRTLSVTAAAMGAGLTITRAAVTLEDVCSHSCRCFYSRLKHALTSRARLAACAIMSGDRYEREAGFRCARAKSAGGSSKSTLGRAGGKGPMEQPDADRSPRLH